jgi:hypothetical protein
MRARIVLLTGITIFIIGIVLFSHSDVSVQPQPTATTVGGSSPTAETGVATVETEPGLSEPAVIPTVEIELPPAPESPVPTPRVGVAGATDEPEWFPYADEIQAPAPSAAFRTAVSALDLPSIPLATVKGSKVLLVLLPQCTVCGKNWGLPAGRREQTEDKIRQAVSWWQNQVNSRLGVSNQYWVEFQVITVDVDPMAIKSSQDKTWIDRVAAGYISQLNSQGAINIDVSTLSAIDKVRYINRAILLKYPAAEGAYTLMLPDAQGDADGMFPADPDGIQRFGYTYSPNILTVLTSTAGPWGFGALTDVFKHEFGHEGFSTKDKYAPFKCNVIGGYLSQSALWPESTLNKDAHGGGPGCNNPPGKGIMSMTSLNDVEITTLKQAGMVDEGSLQNGQIVRTPDNFPDIYFPEWHFFDQGNKLVTINSVVIPHPLTSGVPIKPPEVTSAYLLASGTGQKIPLQANGVRTLADGSKIYDFKDVGIAPQLEGVTLVLEIPGMPDFRKIVRAGDMRNIFLPIIRK